MTVQRYRDGAWGEVNKVGKPLDDVSVDVRREGEWQEIWPSVDIPDIVENQSFAWYPFDEYADAQTENFEDQSPNDNDLDRGRISGMTTINGVQASDFDGTDDFLSSDEFSDIFPCTVFVVLDMGGSSDQCVSNLDNDTAKIVGYDIDSDDDWELNAEKNVSATNSDADAGLLTSVFDDGASLIRQDGDDILIDGDVGTRDADIINVGARALEGKSEDSHFEGAIGELIVYDDILDSGKIDEVEEYLAGKWGFTI